MSSPKARPEVESLEGRTVLSPLLGALSRSPKVSVQLVHGTTLRLHGTLRGTYSSSVVIPDVGANFSISSAGTLGSLGRVSAKGIVNGTGMIAQGRADGSLEISTKKGNLIVILEGPVQPGFSGLPSRFQYVISGGTGAYQDATGLGTVAVKVASRPALAHNSTVATSIVLSFRPNS